MTPHSYVRIDTVQSQPTIINMTNQAGNRQRSRIIIRRSCSESRTNPLIIIFSSLISLLTLTFAEDTPAGREGFQFVLIWWNSIVSLMCCWSPLVLFQSGSSEDKPIRPFRLQRNSNSLCVAHGGNPIKMQMMIGMEEVGAEFRYRKIVAHPWNYSQLEEGR